MTPFGCCCVLLNECCETAASRFPGTLRSPKGALESLKGKRCCRQVKFYRGVCALAARRVLPFKDSEGETWPLQLSDFKRTYICRHAPVKKHSQYADRSMGFAPQQQFCPAISEAAESRWATVSAIKLPDASRWSEARPR
jgi:hypothetical protein